MQVPQTRLSGRVSLETWQLWWFLSSSSYSWECAAAWWRSTSDIEGFRTISQPLPTPTITLVWALPSSPPGTNWVRHIFFFFFYFSFNINGEEAEQELRLSGTQDWPMRSHDSLPHKYSYEILTPRARTEKSVL